MACPSIISKDWAASIFLFTVVNDTNTSYLMHENRRRTAYLFSSDPRYISSLESHVQSTIKLNQLFKIDGRYKGLDSKRRKI